MKNIRINKTLVVIELITLGIISLFAIDFLSSNRDEFLRICGQAWPTDVKQYDLCMNPFFKQTNLDKYVLGIGLSVLVLVPILHKKFTK